MTIIRIPYCPNTTNVGFELYNLPVPFTEDASKSAAEHGKQLAQLMYDCIPICFFDAFCEKLKELKGIKNDSDSTSAS